jgi:hypothetical protein
MPLAFYRGMAGASGCFEKEQRLKRSSDPLQKPLGALDNVNR